MAYLLTNDELNDLLEGSWDNLCLFAYGQFLDHGRGFIGIDRAPENDGFQLIYVTVAQDSTFDDKIKFIVANYDTDKEMVLHFACAQGQYRTVRLKNKDGRGPETVWGEIMMKRKQGNDHC